MVLSISSCQTDKFEKTDRPPNLVLVLVDDMGYADVGFNGCTDIPTPNIDRIARDGTWGSPIAPTGVSVECNRYGSW